MKSDNNFKILKQPSKKYFYIVIILIVGLVISVAANGWLFFGPSGNALKVSIEKIKNQYNLLNPARKLINQEDLIINIQSLRDELSEIGKNKNISIYFEYLPTGANISINKDAEFWPASLLKLPVAMAAGKKI